MNAGQSKRPHPDERRHRNRDRLALKRLRRYHRWATLREVWDGLLDCEGLMALIILPLVLAVAIVAMKLAGG